MTGRDCLPGRLLNCALRPSDTALRRAVRTEVLVPLDVYDSLEPDPQMDSACGHPYIGILFECCGVYARVYRRPHEPAYRGRCPRCLRAVVVRVGPDGISARLFRAF